MDQTVTLYDVKTAAKIVGVSTNTLYKYLLEGKIAAARGTHRQGRFRIPHTSLETFLGTTIPQSQSVAETPNVVPSLPRDEVGQPPNHSSYLPILRLLLGLSLVALIADTLTNPSWSITSGIFRLFSLTLIFLSLYFPKGANA